AAVAAVGRNDLAAVAAAAEHADDTPLLRVDAPHRLGLRLSRLAAHQPCQRAAALPPFRARHALPPAEEPRPVPTLPPALRNPSASLPARSTSIISGSEEPALKRRSPPRTTSPKRPILRTIARKAGRSPGPRPKTRAISRVPTASGLSRRNSSSACGDGSPWE